MNRQWYLLYNQQKCQIPNTGEFIVGKSADATLKIDVPYISRRHGKFYFKESTLRYMDLGSANGSFIRGLELEPHREYSLDEGECIEMAQRLSLEVSCEEELELINIDKKAEDRISAEESVVCDGLEEAFKKIYEEISLLPESESVQKTDELLSALDASKFDVVKKELLRKELLAAGPITELLADPTVSEIILNGAEDIWMERDGSLQKIPTRFISEATLLYWVRKILALVGRKIDQRNPYVDARFADGSRICAVTTPAVLGGTHVCIRKFVHCWNDLGHLTECGTLSLSAKEYLQNAIQNKKNILISGSTGSGKTTLLNALARIVPHNERIVTLEDVAELAIDHPHVVRLESRPANLEGEGEITLRMLLRTALRMRPDRLIIGECRGSEALDLLQALNTGHAGSMSTIHANSSRDALARLELLCLLGETMLQPQVVRTYISSAIHVLVHLKRDSRRRSIETVHEVCGLEDGIFLLKQIQI